MNKTPQIIHKIVNVCNSVKEKHIKGNMFFYTHYTVTTHGHVTELIYNIDATTCYVFVCYLSTVS